MINNKKKCLKAKNIEIKKLFVFFKVFLKIHLINLSKIELRLIEIFNFFGGAIFKFNI